MINTINTKHITDQDRRETLRRAMFTTPFYTRLDFMVQGGITSERQQGLYNASVPVNNNFYLTEIVGNFGEVAELAGLCNVAFWTMYERSLYRYNTGQLLPSGMVTTEARFQAPINTQIFDDRQREVVPTLIPDGDKIFGQILPISTPSEDAQITTVLKGYNVLPNTFVDSNMLEICEASLAKPARYEYFSFTAEKIEGKKFYTIENDQFPRLMLGFGVTNTTANKAQVNQVEIRIKDISRRLAFSELMMPLDFIAPRLTCLADAHLYYLPVEYYLEPFAKIQFEVDNTFTEASIQGFEFNMLTRTV